MRDDVQGRSIADRAPQWHQNIDMALPKGGFRRSASDELGEMTPASVCAYAAADEGILILLGATMTEVTR